MSLRDRWNAINSTNALFMSLIDTRKPGGDHHEMHCGCLHCNDYLSPISYFCINKCLQVGFFATARGDNIPKTAFEIRCVRILMQL